MEIRVPIIIKDPETTRYGDIETFERVTLEEDFFLDGPVARRVAVLDLDPGTGDLPAGVPFLRSGPSGSYALAGDAGPGDPDVLRVSVFGTVYETIAMFEEPDSLGRSLRWAFDGPQLLVVPRAGEWANAFYERESRSLQFFFFQPPDRRRPIYTSQSQDIVAHETAHAVLDGIAPDLYHATSPQALALHEAVADLAAALLAFRTRALARAVLSETGGSIHDSTAFNTLAPQFAEALYGRGALRDLLNQCSLRPDAAPRDRVDPHEPHDLSRVLSGALYQIMVRLHERLKDEYAAKPMAEPALVSYAEQAVPAPEDDAPPAPTGLAGLSAAEQENARRRVAAKALAVAAARFKRTLIRGLDYLPPGDISFADLGRAILAADEASHPDSPEQRTWLREEMVRRGMVEHERDLDVETNASHRAVEALDLEQLVNSDWAAYQFASRNRRLLRIPSRIPFEVRPRLDVRKRYYHREGASEVRECIFKVSWSELEANDLGRGLPKKRRVVHGTTLAIDWETRRTRALLTTDHSAARQADRTALLQKLLRRGILRVGEEAPAPDGRPLSGSVRGEIVGGVLRLRGASRLLHLIAED